MTTYYDTLNKMRKTISMFPILLFLLFLITPTSAFAESTHGLSLYGPEGLKYKTGQPYEYANPKAPKGGHLYLSSFGAFTKLNPMSLKGVPAPGIAELIFQSPMDGSADEKEAFSTYGNLVEKVDLADDRMSLIYHIRKNALFSDGHPVTADDFVFSHEIISDPEYHPFWKGYFNDIKKVEKLDTHKVKYTFSIENQELPLITGQMPIIPKHIYGAKGKTFGSGFDEMAVGSGPYTIEKFKFGQYITFKRNPNWWGKDLAINQGRYNYDKVTWKVFLDPVAEREGFKGGAYDFRMVNSSRDWALDFKGDFIKKKYYLREELPHNRVAGMQGFAMNLRNEIFQSRKVRAAISMVFDFDWSNKNLFYNQYTRNMNYFDNNLEMRSRGIPKGKVKELLLKLKNRHGVFVPKTAISKPVGAPGQGIPLEKNIKLANALLKSEGWEMRKDGIRQKNGKRLSFEIILGTPQFNRIVEPYINNLKKIGAEMKIKVVQAAQYEERQRAFKYDMIIAGFGQSRSPGNEQRSLWSTKAATTPGSRNLIGIQNPAIDELIDIIVQAKTREDLIVSIQALDRILTHQFYVVPHWYIGYDRVVMWNKFSRPKIDSSNAPPNDVLQWWWFDNDKVKKLKNARSKGIAIK